MRIEGHGLGSNWLRNAGWVSSDTDDHRHTQQGIVLLRQRKVDDGLRRLSDVAVLAVPGYADHFRWNPAAAAKFHGRANRFAIRPIPARHGLIDDDHPRPRVRVLLVKCAA